MSNRPGWEAVQEELDRHRKSGAPARLWLRDDDCVDATAGLEQFIKLVSRYDIPLMLATIPRPATRALAERLKHEDLVSVCTHGYAHINHAPPGEKSQELGAHRPAAEVIDEISRGQSRLHSLFGNGLMPIMVPPWNRIAPDVAAALPSLGISALSTFADADEAQGIAGLQQVNTHLDIIDWRGTRGGRDSHWLIAELAGLLRMRREGPPAPIGILTHHLVHDDAAWQFLEELLETTASHDGARWLSAQELLTADRG